MGLNCDLLIMGCDSVWIVMLQEWDDDGIGAGKVLSECGRVIFWK
jgi:hypothetical protein